MPSQYLYFFVGTVFAAGIAIAVWLIWFVERKMRREIAQMSKRFDAMDLVLSGNSGQEIRLSATTGDVTIKAGPSGDINIRGGDGR